MHKLMVLHHQQNVLQLEVEAEVKVGAVAKAKWMVNLHLLIVEAVAEDAHGLDDVPVGGNTKLTTHWVMP